MVIFADQFDKADDKRRLQLQKTIHDIVKAPKHCPVPGIGKRDIQESLLAALSTVVRNLPAAAAFDKMSYALRSSWLECTLNLLDRDEFTLEQCKFDESHQPNGPTDIVERYRQHLLKALEHAITLLQTSTSQGKLLEKVVNVFTRAFIRTDVLKAPMMGIVQELILSEDKAYTDTELKKKALMDHPLNVSSKATNSTSAATKSSPAGPGAAPSPRVYGWEGEVKKLMMHTREQQRSDQMIVYEMTNPTLFFWSFFSDGTGSSVLPSSTEEGSDIWLLKLVGHCGHFCVFLQELIKLVLAMSHPVKSMSQSPDTVVWSAIPCFQRLLRLFCHVIMRVQQFDPEGPPLNDWTERGLPQEVVDKDKDKKQESSEPQHKLLRARRLLVQKSPAIVKAVKECSIILLKNSDVNVFNLFLHALFARTNVHNRLSVRRCLRWLQAWIREIQQKSSQIDLGVSSEECNLDKKKLPAPTSFFGRLIKHTDAAPEFPKRLLPAQLDFSYMIDGLATLIKSRHHQTLEMTLEFLYKNLPLLVRDKHRERAIFELILDPSNFQFLFLYWSQSVRGLFHYILAYSCFLLESRSELPLGSDSKLLGQRMQRMTGKVRKKSRWICKMNRRICKRYEKCFAPFLKPEEFQKRPRTWNAHTVFSAHGNNVAARRGMDVWRMDCSPAECTQGAVPMGSVHFKPALDEYKKVLRQYYMRLKKNSDRVTAPELHHVKDYLSSECSDQNTKKETIDKFKDDW